MKANPYVLVGLIVILPLGLLTLAVAYIGRHEQTLARERMQQFMMQRLDELNASIARFFDRVERELRHQTAIDHFDLESLREINRREPRFLQLFVLSPQGDLVYPDPRQSLNGSEKSFLSRTSKMFADQDLETAVSLTDELDGWLVWYWDRGENLIFWQRRPSGYLVGVALERARWTADLIAELPETKLDSTLLKRATQSFETGLRLVDASSAVVYQWGQVEWEETPEGMKPFCELAVSAPLTSWRLQCLISPESQRASLGPGLQWSLWMGLTGIGLGLTTLATLLLRNYSRDLREASQQVSFVNHVSHELKTPLTNIRMYAELLERDLSEWKAPESERSQQRLQTILSESERLSRLIGNVLTFGRHQRKLLAPQYRSIDPSEVIHTIVDRFRPSLEGLGLNLELVLEATGIARMDPDFIEQILGNLISNVEKYAISGRRIGIRCRWEGEVLLIQVDDDGPGIPAESRETVFEPFRRLDNDISSAAGTGIGLTIARELARLHGGDVRLLERQPGCSFEVRLHAERV